MSPGSSFGKSKSGRNGEPIFNVFDGLLADIESLRNTGPEASEWDDDEDVYNTPEAARARIAFDVKALRDELELANSVRISVESDIARLREEFAAQLEMERKGRAMLEKRLSERDISMRPNMMADGARTLPDLAPVALAVPVAPVLPSDLAPLPSVATPPPAITISVAQESKVIETDSEANPLQQELDESKAKNRMLEKELEKLQQAMGNLHKETEHVVSGSIAERSQVTQELERQRNVNKQLDIELVRMTKEVQRLTEQNIQPHDEQRNGEEIKVLQAEVDALHAQQEQTNKQHEEQIRIAREQAEHQRDEMFLAEREHLIQQRNELMQVELQKLSEREEERTQAALEIRSKQLDAIIAAHEEERQRLESERDQARRGETTKAKELEELKAKYQKLKALPPKPKPTEPKAVKHAPEIKVAEPKVAEAKPRLAQSQPVPAHEGRPDRRLSHPEVVAAPSVATNTTMMVPEEPHREPVPQAQRVAAAAVRLGHSAPALQSDQPKQPSVTRRGSQPNNPRSEEVPERNTTSPPPDATASKTETIMQRALSHGAVNTSNQGPARHGATTRSSGPPSVVPPAANSQKGSISTNLSAKDDVPTQDTQEGPRRLAVAGPARRTIVTRPQEDNSLATNALFQQRRLSTQGLLDPTPAPQTPQPHSPPSQAPQPQAPQSQGNPVLRRAASSLPSVPSIKE